MINKTRKNNQSLFDILDNRKSSFQSICNLNYHELESIYKEIKKALGKEND